jgi:hypothetical protein
MALSSFILAAAFGACGTDPSYFIALFLWYLGGKKGEKPQPGDPNPWGRAAIGAAAGIAVAIVFLAHASAIVVSAAAFVAGLAVTKFSGR